MSSSTVWSRSTRLRASSFSERASFFLISIRETHLTAHVALSEPESFSLISPHGALPPILRRFRDRMTRSKYFVLQAESGVWLEPHM